MVCRAGSSRRCRPDRRPGRTFSPCASLPDLAGRVLAVSRTRTDDVACATGSAPGPPPSRSAPPGPGPSRWFPTGPGRPR
ncbi:hypothetical protein [Ornithinimicrobium kibberense]|uniref:hypothetical protein n=1 Tax=Ornithinimicrobium kibberense TaxID=282060 RepID=UPI0036086BD3